MPHDKNGELLQTGDAVVIHGTVMDVQPNDEFCNVKIMTEEIMHPGPHKSEMWLNTKQVVKKIAGAVVLLLALLLWADCARAQSNAPVSLPVGKTVWKVVTDAAAFFKDNTNVYNADVVTVEAVGLYNNKSYGAAVDLQFPVAGQLSIGFAAAYLDKNFYDGALTARLGTTWNVPVLGPVYSFVETGPGYNISTGEVIAHNFTGVLWKKQVAAKWQLTIGGGAGYFSDRPGAVIAAGGSLSYKFR